MSIVPLFFSGFDKKTSHPDPLAKNGVDDVRIECLRLAIEDFLTKFKDKDYASELLRIMHRENVAAVVNRKKTGSGHSIAERPEGCGGGADLGL